MAKITDHDGPEFGSKIEMRSKVLQKSRKLNPEQTASLMAASGSTDYSWRVGRAAFLNTLGYTLISSQKEVEKVKKRILAEYISKQTQKVKRHPKGDHCAPCERSDNPYRENG